jgi:predicted DNA-binding transcriptional regulator AlpA
MSDAQVTPSAADNLQPILVDARKAAFMLGISRAGFLRLRASGRTPQPLKLGTRALWRVDEIREWVAAGCPPLHRWEVLYKARWNTVPSSRRPQTST